MTPKSGGGWKVSGGSRSKEYRTQAEAEQAARSELLAKGGAYARLWNRQMGGFINAA